MSDTPAINPAAGLPEEVRLAVNALTRHAETMLNLGQMLDQSAQTMGWHCSKATRYRDNAAMHRVDARRLAAEIQALAKELEEGAMKVNPEIEIHLHIPGLEAAKDKMDSWLDHNAPGGHP